MFLEPLSNIIIKGSLLLEALTEFPVMVRVTKPEVLAIGYDMRKRLSVTTGSGEQCYVEIESWEDDEVILWVKVPMIPAGIDSVLHLNLLNVDNTYIGDTLDPSTPSVWSNGYVSVFHLAGHAYDSCAARNHGVAAPGVVFTDAKTGIGAEFMGVTAGSPSIRIPDHPSYSPINNDPVTQPANGVVAGRICVQLQIKPTVDWLGAQWKVPLYKGYPIEYKFNVFGSEETYGGRRFYVFKPDGGYGVGGDIGNKSGHLPTEVGRWYLLNGQSFHDPDDGGCLVAAYQDGEPGFGVAGIGGDVDQDIGFDNYTLGEGNPDRVPIQMADTSSPLWIGTNPYQSGLDCVIDEVRISSVNRRIAWMKADLLSQNGELAQVV